MTTSDEWAEKLQLGQPLSPTQLAHANMRIQAPPQRKPTPADPDVYKLASDFLEDMPNGSNRIDRLELAGQIQDLIETFIEDLERKEAEEAAREPYIP